MPKVLISAKQRWCGRCKNWKPLYSFPSHRANLCQVCKHAAISDLELRRKTLRHAAKSRSCTIQELFTGIDTLDKQNDMLAGFGLPPLKYKFAPGSLEKRRRKKKFPEESRSLKTIWLPEPLKLALDVYTNHEHSTVADAMRYLIQYALDHIALNKQAVKQARAVISGKAQLLSPGLPGLPDQPSSQLQPIALAPAQTSIPKQAKRKKTPKPKFKGDNRNPNPLQVLAHRKEIQDWAVLNGLVTREEIELEATRWQELWDQEFGALEALRLKVATEIAPEIARAARETQENPIMRKFLADQQAAEGGYQEFIRESLKGKSGVKFEN